MIDHGFSTEPDFPSRGTGPSGSDWAVEKERAMSNPATTYKISRFRFKGDKRAIKRGLTLEQAQAHCQREDTHGDGWFDGYDEDV